MPKKATVNSTFQNEVVVTEDSDSAREIYNQSRFGTILENNCVQLSLLEAFYLLKKDRTKIFDGRKKAMSEDTFIKKAKKSDPNFIIRFSVYQDLRNRGYIVKTALKFGADFRVYDRGIKPGEDHAKWVVYPVHEGKALTWYEFAAKNRVAHSTKKRLLIGIVDDECDVTYYEIRWMRP